MRDSMEVLEQQDDRANKANRTNGMDNFVFMGFCFSHFKIIANNRMKSKRKFEIQIFVGSKFH